MRNVLFIAVLALVLVGTAAVLLARPAAADTPTTSPTPTPTPTPTPYPPDSSVITIRFVQSGQPIELEFSLPVSRITADGAGCTPYQFPIITTGSEFTYGWPERSSIYPYECRKGPPTFLHFEFDTTSFVHLETDVLWEGDDVTTEIEVPRPPECEEAVDDGLCAYTGTLALDGPCHYIESDARGLIGPVNPYFLGGFEPGDRIQVVGWWVGAGALGGLECLLPLGPWALALEEASAAPLATPSPAPTGNPALSPTPTPAGLPQAGGEAGGASPNARSLVLAAGALALAAGALAMIAWALGSGRWPLPFLVFLAMVAAFVNQGAGPTAGQAANYSSAAEGDEIVAGRINVKLVDGADADVVLAGHSLSAHEPLFEGTADPDLSRWLRVSVPDGQEMEKVIEMAQDPGVEWVEPSVILTDALSLAPNDPCYLPPNAGCPTYQWGLEKVSMAGAWDVATASSAITVAVVDSGVDATHDDLEAAFVSEVDFTGQGTGDGCPGTSLAGHGTHVAGIAAARAGNGIGIAGGSWRAALRSYKTGYLEYGGCKVAVEELDDAIRRAAEDSADVINISISGGAYFRSIEDAVDFAWSEGSVIVAAAGNQGLSRALYPAALDRVIAVAATDQADARAVWPGSGSSNYGTGVDIAAPGSGILSTFPGGTYVDMNGTSMASPLVAGVAALLAARGFYNCEIVETLLDPQNVDPVNSSQYLGVGRLNAAKALQWWGGGPIVSAASKPDHALVREESDAGVYVLLGGRKCLIGSPQDLTDMGYSWRNVQCVPDGFLDNVASGPADRQLVRVYPSTAVYVSYCGAQVWVPGTSQLSVLTSNGYAGPAVYDVPPGSIGGTSPLPDSCHVREHSSSTNYAVCGASSMKWTIPNAFVLGRLGFSSATEHVLWVGGLSSYGTQSVISACLDTDGDGSTNLHETYMGTDPLRDCPVSSTPDNEPVDPWPPDFNDNRFINTSDVVAMKPVFGMQANAANPGAARYDVVFTQSINVGDVLALKPVFATSCSP